MFTGIIESLGTLVSVRANGQNLDFEFAANFSHELKVDQSLAHNGVCLTVTQISNGHYWVTAIQETLNRTNLGSLKPGDKVNLERCMRLADRVDGHIVQGHVDTTAVVESILEEGGSWKIRFKFSPEHAGLLVDKGSITINGVSLTVIQPGDDFFSVAIIPFTWENTGFHQIQVGDTVNLEFDILGKFVKRMLELSGRF